MRLRVGDPALVTLLAAQVAPAAAVGDADLLHGDVDQRSGVVVLVAAKRFTGDPVDAREPVDPAPHQHGVHRRGRQPEPAAFEQLEDGCILCTITAYPRPASTVAKLGGPISRAAQSFMTQRYVRA